VETLLVLTMSPVSSFEKLLNRHIAVSQTILFQSI